MILDCYGRILSETWKASDMMVTAVLDPNLRLNNTGKRWMTARRPALYAPLSELTGKEVDIRSARYGTPSKAKN